MKLDDLTIRAVLDQLPDAAAVVDRRGALQWVNAAAGRLLGRAPDLIAGTMAVELIHPDDLRAAARAMESMLRDDGGDPLVLRVATGAGGWEPIELVGSVLRDASGTPAGFVVAARSVRIHGAGGDPRRHEEDKLRALIERGAGLTALLTPSGRLDSVSGAWCRLLGYEPGAIVGSAFTDLIDLRDRDRAARALRHAATAPATTSFDAQFRTRDGARLVPLECAITNLVDDDAVGGLVISAHDITRLRRAELAVQHLATHDTLTNLPNRALLLDRLAVALERNARLAGTLAVLYVDLDRFKPINTLLGHSAGDEVLIEVARRLQAVTRPADTVARLASDEFVVVTEGLADPAEARVLAERIEAAVAAPFVLAATQAQLYASVGVVVVDDAPGSPESTVAEAEAAMQMVKQQRRGASLLPPSQRVADRRALAEELASALCDRAIRPYFQPVVTVATGTIAGFEALARWEHPQRGLLGPSEFLGVLEDAGLEVELADRMMSDALRELARWLALLGDDHPLTMAVNLSGTQLADPQLPARVRAVLDTTAVAPWRLCIEVTERAVLERSARGTSVPVVDVLHELKHLGVRVAVDDFGTGYSSLSHLRHLPVDVLKIDRSFVAGLGADGGDTSIVAAVVGLARALGLVAVAEGVETHDQLYTLRSMGCELAQGFLLGYPRPAVELTPYLVRGLSLPVG